MVNTVNKPDLKMQLDFVERQIRSWSQVIDFLQEEFSQQHLDVFSEEAMEHICHLEAIKTSLQTLQATRK